MLNSLEYGELNSTTTNKEFYSRKNQLKVISDKIINTLND